MSFWEVAAPTWLQGVGTVGAFVTGGIILLRELSRDRERQAADERRQASSISAWLTRPESDDGTKRISRLYLSNASEAPVYDLTVRYKSDDTELADHVGVLPPGRSDRALPSRFEEVWIKVANGWLRSRPPAEEEIPEPASEPWTCSITLEFRDAAGLKWVRSTDGTLSRD